MNYYDLIILLLFCDFIYMLFLACFISYKLLTFLNDMLWFSGASGCLLILDWLCEEVKDFYLHLPTSWPELPIYSIFNKYKTIKMIYSLGSLYISKNCSISPKCKIYVGNGCHNIFCNACMIWSETHLMFPILQFLSYLYFYSISRDLLIVLIFTKIKLLKIYT